MNAIKRFLGEEDSVESLRKDLMSELRSYNGHEMLDGYLDPLLKAARKLTLPELLSKLEAYNASDMLDGYLDGIIKVTKRDLKKLKAAS